MSNLPVQTNDIPIEDGILNPKSLDQLYRLCVIVSKSGMCPKEMNTPEKLVVASQMGMAIGLDFFQSIQNIAVINGRPSIWGDAMLATVRASGTLQDFDEHFEGEYPQDTFRAVCRGLRKGYDRWTENEFSIADAKKAGLWGKGGPWQNHPKRMLKMRARAFTLRDGWPDGLKGLYCAEEMIGENERKPINVTPIQTEQAQPEAVEPVFEDIFSDILGPELTDYLTNLKAKGMPIEKIKKKALVNPDGFRKALNAFVTGQADTKGDDKPTTEKAPGTGDKAARLGDDPNALKRFHAMIGERGYNVDLVKNAMRDHQLHPIGQPASKPFDFDSSKEILVADLPYFKEYLDSLKTQHEYFEATGAHLEEGEPNPYRMTHASATQKLREIRLAE